MRLVERHIVRDDRFRELCVKAKELYNQSLYYWRQSIFGNIEYFTENQLINLMTEFNDEYFRSLPSNTSQQIIKSLFRNTRSWRMAKIEYAKNPNKFLGKPKLPNYKKNLSELYFTSNQVVLKNGFIYFPKITKINPIKTRISSIDCCRIIPKSNHFIVEFVYSKEELPSTPYNGNWMGIDIGLNNMATCVTKNHAVIINGRPSKAINNFYNKRTRQLRQQLTADKVSSKRMDRLTFRRNQKIKDCIHKSSIKVVEIAKENNITKIIIGKNENWKQSIKLGRKTNREFTSIPHATLIEQIKYKAKMVGIEVITTQEAYTSKCSALDLEPICKHETYMGKRKKRGLFVTANGTLINADCNGALNIARLGLSVSGNEIHISDSVMSCVAQPKKINVFSGRPNLLNRFNLK